MPRTLIVPIIGRDDDPDRASELALPLAHAIAGRLGAQVVLVSVLELPVVVSPQGERRIAHAADALPDDERLQALREQTEQRIATHEADLRQLARDAFPDLPARAELRYGDPPRVLLRLAGELPDPLIVMASHGRRGLQRLLLGSVTFAVVSEAHCPVVVVPVPEAGTPVSKQPEPRAVIVPLDGSPAAERILESDLLTLGAADATLHLLRVPEPLVMRGGLVADQYYALARAEAEEYLGGIATRLRARGERVEIHAGSGPPERAIADLAHAVDAGLIAMTTHGRRGFQRLLLGSVAEATLHSAQVPVLLVRPQA